MRRVEARLFLAEVEVQRRRGPVFIAELETPTPLLGVYALETLGFKVNPKTGELEEISPEGGYLLISQPAGIYHEVQRLLSHHTDKEANFPPIN